MKTSEKKLRKINSEKHEMNAILIGFAAIIFFLFGFYVASDTVDGSLFADFWEHMWVIVFIIAICGFADLLQMLHDIRRKLYEKETNELKEKDKE